jgi:uncharacterized membrane protein
MNFAPYQDTDPERERALSPPPPASRGSIDSSRVRSPPPGKAAPQPRPYQDNAALPPPSSFVGDYAPRDFSSPPDRGQTLEAFQTSLPMRMDYEAMLAYLLLPPAGGVLLLIFEHKSDYVRFHAWQSSMLFTCIFILHLMLSWSKVLSWMLFTVDLSLIGFLAMHAYRDVEQLDHYELPLFGRLANRFVDDE